MIVTINAPFYVPAWPYNSPAQTAHYSAVHEMVFFAAGTFRCSWPAYLHEGNGYSPSAKGCCLVAVPAISMNARTLSLYAARLQSTRTQTNF